MPFSLTNTPSTFMSSMNEILKEYIGKFIIVYLDEILVYNKTKEKHLKHLRLVLNILQQEKLLINLKKCTFMKKELVYLGFILSKNGLKMDPKKYRAIIVGMCHGMSLRSRSFIVSQVFTRNSSDILQA